LTFGNSFNQPIEPNVLPESLRYLVLGNNFNQSIGPDVLPESLEYLEIPKTALLSKIVFPSHLEVVYKDIC